MKKILFQDTSFRDGFQSVFGARVLTEDFIPAVEAARESGDNSFRGREEEPGFKVCFSTAANRLSI